MHKSTARAVAALLLVVAASGALAIVVAVSGTLAVVAVAEDGPARTPGADAAVGPVGSTLDLPPDAPGPEGRVLFAPRLGRTGIEVPGDVPQRSSGLTIQNLGDRETAFIAVYFDAVPAGDDAVCASCAYAGSECFDALPPGLRLRIAPPPIDWDVSAGGTDAETLPGRPSAVVYSLSTRPARVYGQAWIDYVAALGLPENATVADVACTAFDSPPADGPTGTGRSAAGSVVAGSRASGSGIAGSNVSDLDAAGSGASGSGASIVGRRGARRGSDPAQLPSMCDLFAEFHAGFLGDDAATFMDTGLPIAPLRGEPIGAVVAAVEQPSPARVALDRYAAVPLSETGLPSAMPAQRTYTYVAPGGYGETQDGNHGELVVQNAGTDCVTVTVTAHRTSDGPLGSPVVLSVPPGTSSVLDVRGGWPELSEQATLRLSSDGPLATTLTTQNFATSATSTATRERDRATRWLVPRAWQEQRDNAADVLRGQLPLPALGRRVSEPGVERTMAGSAEGWETNISIFNPAPAQREVQMRMQATGEPPRGPIGYPVPALAQIVLQPGFGLGMPGGPGWMELWSDMPPMSVAVEGIREAPNVPGLVVETWAVPAWPDEEGVPPSPAIGLPDLGGPAVGNFDPGTLIGGTPTMTNLLVASIAIQNPLTRTTRVAIDSYAQLCGYAGTIERLIDPRQAIVVPVAELPGTAFGADAAVVRVLQGAAAATVEIVRTGWPPASLADPPSDLSSAYNGLGVGVAAPPAVVTATLSVTPTVLTIDPGDVRVSVQRTVAVHDDAHTSRCLSITATSNAAWLQVEPATTAVPGVLTLSVDPRLLGPGREHTATVTLVAREPGVAGSPVEVHVTVLYEGGSSVFFPSALRRHGVPSTAVR